MPAQRITMRKIKDVLRLKFEGKLAHQQIADALGLSKGVVTKHVGLAVAAGLDWMAIYAMDEATLGQRLLPYPQPSDVYAQADFRRIHRELARNGMTLTLLWEEYCAQVGDEFDPVDREVHGRQERRCARLLKNAKLKYPQAAIEDLDSRSTRGLERATVLSLALGE